jgi:hypothetical protein
VQSRKKRGKKIKIKIKIENKERQTAEVPI